MGDIFKIMTVGPYPNDYNTVVNMARKEKMSDYRPKLAKQVSMETYDVIFIGYPIWWGTMPMAVFTFLEKYDFSGKKIIPFCTHEGSSFSRSTDDIKALCPRSIILDGLAIRGGSVRTAGKDVLAWLNRIGVIKEKLEVDPS